ncbi:MAG: histidine kinase dimerization/phospho-acceptor domain-containing protein [Candidatus Zixiibacteriota bacterium]
MSNDNTNRFELLSRLVRAATTGKDMTRAAEGALEMLAELVGLSAATLYLFESGQKPASIGYSKDDKSRLRLAETERELFESLRKERQLASAYLSFAGSPPYHVFTIPLQMGTSTFGAVIGCQEGARTVVSEDDLLSTLCSVLSLAYAALGHGDAGGFTREQLDSERLTAIIETAVTVNHEVNNPLTAILGNIQLLLMKRTDLDDDLRAKLKTVEESAMKIRDVTQKLLRLTSAKSVRYADDTTMIDISGDDE